MFQRVLWSCSFESLAGCVADAATHTAAALDLEYSLEH